MENKLKEIMKEEGRTQKWLSQKVGVSETTMSSIINKKSTPSLQVAMKIAKALDKSVEELWTEDK